MWCFLSFVLIVIIIIIAITAVRHDEDKLREEQERLAAEERNRQYLLEQEAQKERYFNAWCKNLDDEFERIEYKAGLNDPLVTRCYYKIREFEKESESRRKKYFEAAIVRHCDKLQKMISKKLTSGRSGLKESITLITYLKAAKNDDLKFNTAINAIEQFCSYCESTYPKYISFGEYGDITLPLDEPEEMEYMIKNASEMLEDLLYSMHCFTNNREGYFEGVAQYCNRDFIDIAARLMWFYAKQKPFDVNSFEQIRRLYHGYTYGIPYEHVEEILAIIYSKNQLGGKSTVEQEKEGIIHWISCNEEYPEECARLASGLAWMELYDLERDVLRSMVQNKISMAPELQERLTLLESGNNMNIKVYTIEDTDDFVYDSSAASWTSNDMEAFFRKLGMKRLTLNYSLAVSEWKKTLPLTGGQKASMDQLYAEFQKVMLDFDGEVVCFRKTARAIDLDNVEYPDAVLFRFTSERSRGLTLMFSCEKFGRNLNITILTFFTPEAGMDAEKMQKYAASIKSNIYVESFIETLLQAVDEVLKERQEIYDEGNVAESNPSKKIVE